jgi:hypothetical protein
MKREDIAVEARLSPPGKSDKIKAFADVTIPLGAEGVIKISGCSVIQSNGDAPRVVPPARKGNSRYFDVIALIGKIRSLVDEAVLMEYERINKSEH